LNGLVHCKRVAGRLPAAAPGSTGQAALPETPSGRLRSVGGQDEPRWKLTAGILSDTIYKIAPETLWREAEAAGVFAGAPVDLADGYIHFSTAAQARETAAKHFAGQEDLLLVAIDAGALGDALKWEPSRGGALFPHLYGALPLSAVRSVRALPLGADGVHVFPEMA
jgi:uncharacterized protein (DUF952 family)